MQYPLPDDAAQPTCKTHCMYRCQYSLSDLPARVSVYNYAILPYKKYQYPADNPVLPAAAVIPLLPIPAPPAATVALLPLIPVLPATADPIPHLNNFF